MDTDAPIIVLLKNPLDHNDAEVVQVEAGSTLIDWLTANYPDGFGRPIKVVLNEKELPFELTDTPLAKGDKVGVLVTPGGPAIGAILLPALIGAIASIAATFIVTLIFGKPKGPNNQVPSPDPVYSLNGGANSARLGEPVPVGYGRFITYPDYVCQPYSYFEKNEQYLDQVLCIGQGDYDIEGLMVADTPVSILAPGTITWRKWSPGDHRQAQGTVEAATGISETMVTSLEVSDIELSGQAPDSGSSTPGWTGYQAVGDIISATLIRITSPMPPVNVGASVFLLGAAVYRVTAINGSDVTVDGPIAFPPSTGLNISFFQTGFASQAGIEAGPFSACMPNDKGTEVQLDFIFPNGLFVQDEKTGNLKSTSVTVEATLQPIDAANNNSGAAITRRFTWTRSTNTPQRITEKIANLPSSRYSVKVRRITPAAPNTRTQTTFVWTGLKMRLDKVTTPVYGDVTLVSVRIRATNALSSDVANKLRVIATRKLKPFGSGTEVASRSPADAFIDVITNPSYGAGRAISEIDIARLRTLAAHWGAEGKFDAIVNVRSTVWEALTLVSQTVAAFPSISGKHITMVQDGKRAFPTHVFSPANIVAGSFRSSYSYDKPGDYDGVKVEYRSPVDFSQQYETWPTTAVSPETVNLFGCTDEGVAASYAKLLWQRRRYQRNTVEFETELEGLLPSLGERARVFSEITEWGWGGVVAGYNASTVLLDRDLDWANLTNPTITLRNPDGSPVGPIAITRGTTDRHAVLATATGILAGPQAHGTAIWAVGDAKKMARDFVVSNIEPQGGTLVRISGAVYDERTWDGTFAFMRGDVP